MSDSPIRLEYDDDHLEIIDKINVALASHGLRLQDDMQEHDGFIILNLRETTNGR